MGAPVHLGEAFDYVLPENLQNDFTKNDNHPDLVGYLVGVKFGNRKLTGIVLEMNDESDYDKALKPIDRIISNLPLVTPKLLEFYEKIATYYGARLAEILTFALPARRANAEKAYISRVDHAHLTDEVFKLHTKLPRKQDLLADYDCKNSNELPQKTQLTILPTNNNKAELLAEYALNELVEGKSVLLLVPTKRELDKMVNVLERYISPHFFAIMSGSLDLDTRYTNYLRILNGDVNLVVGTRSAALAPFLPNTVIVTDDASNHYKEERAPFYNARETCLNRECEHLVFAGYVPSSNTERLVQMKYLEAVKPNAEAINKLRVHISGVSSEFGEKVPRATFSAIRTALSANKPVLFMYPRSGYQLLMVCANCSDLAICDDCEGGLRQSNADNYLHCARCYKIYTDWHCPKCNSTRRKNLRIGAEKIAEDLGRAFPGVIVRSSSLSGGNGIIENVHDKAQIVIATPGAEPFAQQGYGLVAILDAHLWETVGSLEGTNDTLSKWFNAISNALMPENNSQNEARTTGDKNIYNQGQVMLVGDAKPSYRDALQRLDPHLVIMRELKERKEHNFPPFVRFAALLGDQNSLENLIKQFSDPEFEILGPFPLDETNYFKPKNTWQMQNAQKSNLECYIIRTPMRNSPRLAHTILKARTLRILDKKNAGNSNIILDPKEFL